MYVVIHSLHTLSALCYTPGCWLAQYLSPVAFFANHNLTHHQFNLCILKTGNKETFS